jgi:hypothetical protein
MVMWRTFYIFIAFFEKPYLLSNYQTLCPHFAISAILLKPIEILFRSFTSMILRLDYVRECFWWRGEWISIMVMPVWVIYCSCSRKQGPPEERGLNWTYESSWEKAMPLDIENHRNICWFIEYRHSLVREIQSRIAMDGYVMEYKVSVSNKWKMCRVCL